MRKRYLLSVLTTFFVSCAACQEKQAVQLSGYVMFDTLRAIPFSSVYVKNKSRGTVCDFWGYYNFVTETGDSIVFSAVGYKKTVFSLPRKVKDNAYTLNVFMKRDTILLPEAIIYPWKTIGQVNAAFSTVEIKDEDIERAKKNFSILKHQMQYDAYLVDAKLNYRYFMQEKYDRLYYSGQYRPMSIFNVMAWSQFFQAIQEGKFKRREKEEREEDFDYGY